MRIDKSQRLKFASLQGETAEQMLGRPQGPVDFDTIVYLREGERFERSTAVLHILSDIGGAWSAARIFLLVPKFMRDFVYKWVARNRYRLMKKRETCRMPTASERDRLLR